MKVQVKILVERKFHLPVGQWTPFGFVFCGFWSPWTGRRHSSHWSVCSSASFGFSSCWGCQWRSSTHCLVCHVPLPLCHLRLPTDSWWSPGRGTDRCTIHQICHKLLALKKGSFFWNLIWLKTSLNLFQKIDGACRECTYLILPIIDTLNELVDILSIILWLLSRLVLFLGWLLLTITGCISSVVTLLLLSMLSLTMRHFANKSSFYIMIC